MSVLPPWTVESLAESLHVHPETIRVAIRSGKLKAYKTARRWRMWDEDVEAYVRGQPSEAPPAPVIPPQRPAGIPARARRR